VGGGEFRQHFQVDVETETYPPRHSNRMTCSDPSQSRGHGASRQPTDYTHNCLHGGCQSSISVHPAVVQTRHGPVSSHDYSDPPTCQSDIMLISKRCYDSQTTRHFRGQTITKYKLEAMCNGIARAAVPQVYVVVWP